MKIKEPQTLTCRNRDCNQTFERTHTLVAKHGDGGQVWYHSAKCRDEARARRQRARRHEHTYSTVTPIAYCRDHETRFSSQSVSRHADCDWIVARPCFHCGKTPDVTSAYRPDGEYCSEKCFRLAWLAKLDLGDLASVEDIVYDPRYLRTKHLEGELTHVTMPELFGYADDDEPPIGYQLINLANWTSNDSIIE